VEEYIDDEKPELGVKLKEKIVTKSKDIRDIGKFIFDMRAIAKMEETRSLTEAYSMSDQVGIDKFNSSLEIIGKQIDVAHYFSEYAKPESKELI